MLRASRLLSRRWDPELLAQSSTAAFLTSRPPLPSARRQQNLPARRPLAANLPDGACAVGKEA